jgi:hypothetical protein
MATLTDTTPSRKFWADAGVTKRAHSKAAARARFFINFPFLVAWNEELRWGCSPSAVGRPGARAAPRRRAAYLGVATMRGYGSLKAG